MFGVRMERSLFLSLFLWSVVEPQTFPYLSFLGETLLNHSYIDIDLIGVNRDGTDSVQCHTNLDTCCTAAQGTHRGDWFSPVESTRLPFPAAEDFVFEDREDQRVDIRRRNASSPTGIYRCTVQVVNGGDGEPVMKFVYVGLYTKEGGNVTISGGVSLSVNSSLNGPTPQFTLTCVSTGGPATTVTWTRDSVTFTRGTETVLVDPATAQYTHTLTVSGRPEGLYTCTVSNSKPSEDSAQLNIAALPDVPEDFEARAGKREVVFSWSPPPVTQHSGNITNYTLTCSPSPSSLPQSPAQSGTLTVAGFSPNTLYSCSVAADNSRGSGPPAITSFTTLEDSLPDVPEDFEARAGKREVVFSWSPPPVTQHSGNITNYTLTCSPSPSSLPQSPAQSGTLTVAGFSPNTLYSCSVAADNSRGSGPPAITSFTTLEDYVIFQLHFSGISSTCKEFESTNEEEKLENVTVAVLEELGDSCTDCVITSDTIDEQYFYCDPECPVFVTYRARLEGTPHTDSSELLSLIEAWVEEGPNITAGGDLLVTPECPVEISSLTDPEEGVCEPPTPPPEDPGLLSLQTISIIAGVGGGVLLIFLVFMAIGLRLLCKYCCRAKRPPEEKALEGLTGIYIIHDKEEREEEEEEFEKKQDSNEKKEHSDEPTPPPTSTDHQKLGSPQDTDDREPVYEDVC